MRICFRCVCVWQYRQIFAQWHTTSGSSLPSLMLDVSQYVGLLALHKKKITHPDKINSTLGW